MTFESIVSKTGRSLLVAVLLLRFAPAAVAEDGWEATVGGGALASNVYCGAEEFFVAPLPVVRAAYRARNLEFFASTLDGLGFNYVDQARSLFASVGVNFGEKRDSETYGALVMSLDHSDDTKRLLAGSPTAWNPAYGFGMLGWISPIGIVAAALYYQPTLVSGASDELFHGFVPSVFWLAPVPVTKNLTVTCLAALDFMDRRYAEAWFSVEEPTAELDAFRAEAGLRDVQLIVRAEYRFTKRLAASVLAGNLYLLSDAADSPYTQTAYRLKAGIYLSYTI